MLWLVIAAAGALSMHSVASAARNLLRDEALSASFLATRQIGLPPGERDRAAQGAGGDIRFPDWPQILSGLVQEGEVIVCFDPQRVGASELLHDARLMACAFLANTHVVAIHRDAQPSPGGRVTFRRYDNDSPARQRGTYVRSNARNLWVTCNMTAITARGSALHKAAGDIVAVGAVVRQRRERRAASASGDAPRPPQHMMRD